MTRIDERINSAHINHDNTGVGLLKFGCLLLTVIYSYSSRRWNSSADLDFRRTLPARAAMQPRRGLQSHCCLYRLSQYKAGCCARLVCPTSQRLAQKSLLLRSSCTRRAAVVQ